MSHLAFGQLVDYWTSDAADTGEIEAHLFACASCAAEAERVAQIVGAFRGQLPPAISAEQLADLRSQGLALEENDFMPGERASVIFGPSLDMLIHHLTRLELRDAERVSLTVRSESTGAPMFHDPFVPFDRERGEVVIACQRHFAAMPADVVFEVEVHRPSAAPTTATYYIPHVFQTDP